jgi:hypothetical protein
MFCIIFIIIVIVVFIVITITYFALLAVMVVLMRTPTPLALRKPLTCFSTVRVEPTASDKAMTLLCPPFRAR